MTTGPLPVPELVGVFVAAGAVVPPLLLALPLVAPPQADKSNTITNATNDSHAHRRCLCVEIMREVMFEFVCIIRLFFFLVMESKSRESQVYLARKAYGISTPHCFLVKNTEEGYTRQKFNNTELKNLDFC